MPTVEAPATDQALVRAKRIHANAIVIDAHADIEISGRESAYVGADGRSKVAPDKMQTGGVDAVVMSVASGPLPRNEPGYQKARRRADRKLDAVAALVADTTNNLVLECLLGKRSYIVTNLLIALVCDCQGLICLKLITMN